MLDASQAARRDAAVVAIPGTVGCIHPLPGASRLSVRLKWTGAVPTASVAGLSFDLSIGHCAERDDRYLLRLGPDEWMIIGPETDTEAMTAQAEAALADRAHAVVDISHRNVGFGVSGPHAAEILNAGCPLDLHPSAFPPGTATRTLLGKAEIVLMRSRQEPVFRVECWRSFGAYVHGFLTAAERNVAALSERP